MRAARTGGVTIGPEFAVATDPHSVIGSEYARAYVAECIELVGNGQRPTLTHACPAGVRIESGIVTVIDWGIFVVVAPAI